MDHLRDQDQAQEVVEAIQSEPLAPKQSKINMNYYKTFIRNYLECTHPKNGFRLL